MDFTWRVLLLVLFILNVCGKPAWKTSSTTTTTTTTTSVHPTTTTTTTASTSNNPPTTTVDPCSGVACSFGYSCINIAGVGTCQDDWAADAFQKLVNYASQPTNTNRAKNVIIFIGDGMSIDTETAARIYKGQLAGGQGEDANLSWDLFPHMALSKTYSTNYQVSDSAATATAILSGVKTKSGVIGLNDRVSRGNCNTQAGNEVDSIMYNAMDAGKSTGIISTARLTHATPACAYAHAADRGWERSASGECTDIAAQLIEKGSDIRVILGGGRQNFLRNSDSDPEGGSGSRTDGRNLIQEWEQDKISRGLSSQYVWNKPGFDAVDPATTDYLMGIFESSHMQYESDRDTNNEPSLAGMTEKAIRILQKNNNGFVLMIEAGRIDHAHHASRAGQALLETVALDTAVQRAMDLTSAEDTLVVVTADHSHTMTFAGYPSRGNDILGTAGSGSDGLPYTTLLYGNGPGYGRTDISGVDTSSYCYTFQSAVPMGSETHAGDDVGIHASGPWSHLLHGVQEQSYIYHAMAYASCLGIYSERCNNAK